MNKREVLKTLNKIKKQIADPTHWCKFYLARNKYNNKTQPCSYDACKWCLKGAINLHTDTNFKLRYQIENLLKDCLPPSFKHRDLAYYNDSRTHKSVMKLLDRAIEKVKIG